MDDYILREAAIAEIKDESGCDSCWARTKDMCKEMCHTMKKIDRIVAIPAADVRPVVKARWIPVSEYWHEYPFYKCSACGKRNGFPSNFCPNCWAQMRMNDGDQ